MDHIQPANSCGSNGSHAIGKHQLHCFHIQLEMSCIIDEITCSQYTVAGAEASALAAQWLWTSTPRHCAFQLSEDSARYQATAESSDTNWADIL